MDRISSQDLDDKEFDNLVLKRQYLADGIKQAKSTMSELDLKIGAILDFNQAKSVVTREDYIVTRKDPPAPRKTIDPVKLIQLGVSPTVIAAATVFGAIGRSSVIIKKVRKGEAEGEQAAEQDSEIDGGF